MTSELTPRFAGEERRSYLIPILLALILLVSAIAYGIHLFPQRSVRLLVTHVELLPTNTVYHSDSIVVGPPASEDDLYVVATLKLENPLPVPVTLDTITCELTTPQDTVLDATAAQKNELPLITQSFPALKPMLTTPLLRETTIAAGSTVQGSVLLHFPITKAKWQARKSAILNLELYHQPSLSAVLP